MLPRKNRLTASEVFAATVRRGRRRGTRTLVLHCAIDGALGGALEDGQGARDATPPEATRVGLVVSKAVGNAVTRTRVKRRLRHLTRDRLGRLPRGSVVVVRALPPAAHASSAQLGADLDTLLSRIVPDGAAA